MVGIYFSDTGNSKFTPRMGSYKVETLDIHLNQKKDARKKFEKRCE